MSRLTERLTKIGVYTARDFAEMAEAEMWITFHETPPMYAVLYTGIAGHWNEKLIYATEGGSRNSAMEETVSIAQSMTDTPSSRAWNHGPMAGAWFLHEDRDKVIRYLELRESER